MLKQKLKDLFLIQSIVLFAGTIFAWITVFSDFTRFYNYYGDILRIQNCVIPNPVTTPCFYGAFAFLFAFIWSIFILKKKQDARVKEQKKLNILLLGGTIFAWSNFIFEAVKFYLAKSQGGPQVSCSGISTTNVFFTPCFYGSLLFLASLLISTTLLKRSK